MLQLSQAGASTHNPFAHLAGALMKVSGFTIIRDGVRLGYPFEQAIHSILPMVDELVVAVGDCSDDTRERIKGIDFPNVRIIDTVWDPAIRAGGKIMAEQTNIALDACTGDWCFYIQADEVVHEDDYDLIRRSMHDNLKQRSVNGLSFRYLHFMGDYRTRNPLIYRKQARIVRNGVGIRSIGDACGFGVGPREKKPRTREHGCSTTGTFDRPPRWLRKPLNLGSTTQRVNALTSQNRTQKARKLGARISATACLAEAPTQR